MSELEGLLDPRSVAIVGVGAGSDGMANRLMRNLLSLGFKGPVFPVTDRYESILDVPCVRDLESIGEPVDLVIVAVAATGVLDVVARGARLGIRNYIILTSGFGEVGDEGPRMDHDLRDLAARENLNVMGPNCAGSINFHSRTHLSFTAMLEGEDFVPGPVAIVGQSGGLATVFYSLAVRHGIGFSHLISSGNESVLNLANYLDYLIADPHTRIIVAYAEQIRDGRHMIELGNRAKAAGKHIIVLKAARGRAGARAALSHTGSIAGNDAVTSAMFRRAGIVKVRTLNEAASVCKALLARFPLPTGRKAALLAISGGSAVMAADLANENGFEVPALSARTRERLREWMPDFASFENPIDVTPGLFYRPDKFAKVLECLVEDPGIDLVVVLGAYQHEIAQKLAEGASTILAGSGKYAAAAWVAGGPEVESHFARHQIPFFDNFAQCFEALDLVVPPSHPCHAGAAAGDGTDNASSRSATVLTEDVVKTRLKAIGVPVLSETVVGSADDAAAAAEKIGYPVAMKIISPDVPHRAKVGGLALGLHSKDAVAAEYLAMVERVRQRVPSAAITGVLVQQMVQPGPELFLGMSHDPSFGRIMTIGLGGILAEDLDQVTFVPVPVTQQQARNALDEIPAVRTLLSFNPGSAVAMAELIAKVGDWCDAQGDRLRELDLNPVMLDAGKPVLIDGLAIMAEAADHV